MENYERCYEPPGDDTPNHNASTSPSISMSHTTISIGFGHTTTPPCSSVLYMKTKSRYLNKIHIFNRRCCWQNSLQLWRLSAFRMFPWYAFKLLKFKEALAYSALTLCIQETPKRVLLKTVKPQMKCSMTLHFIRVYTVRKGKNIFRQKNTTWNPKICTIAKYKFVASNQKEESISIQRVKYCNPVTPEIILWMY